MNNKRKEIEEENITGIHVKAIEPYEIWIKCDQCSKIVPRCEIFHFDDYKSCKTCIEGCPHRHKPIQFIRLENEILACFQCWKKENENASESEEEEEGPHSQKDMSLFKKLKVRADAEEPEIHTETGEEKECKNCTYCLVPIDDEPVQCSECGTEGICWDCAHFCNGCCDNKVCIFCVPKLPGSHLWPERDAYCDRCFSQGLMASNEPCKQCGKKNESYESYDFGNPLCLACWSNSEKAKTKRLKLWQDDIKALHARLQSRTEPQEPQEPESRTEPQEPQEPESRIEPQEPNIRADAKERQETSDTKEFQSISEETIHRAGFRLDLLPPDDEVSHDIFNNLHKKDTAFSCCSCFFNVQTTQANDGLLIYSRCGNTPSHTLLVTKH